MERLISLNSRYSLRFIYWDDEIHYNDIVFVDLIGDDFSLKLTWGYYSELILDFLNILENPPRILPLDLSKGIKKRGISYYYLINTANLYYKEDLAIPYRQDLSDFFLWGKSNDEYNHIVFVVPSNGNLVFEISNWFDFSENELDDFNNWFQNEYRIIKKIELTENDIENLKVQINIFKSIFYW